MEQQLWDDAIAGPITKDSPPEQRLTRIRAVCENPTYRGCMTQRQMCGFLDAIRKLAVQPPPPKVPRNKKRGRSTHRSGKREI